MTDKPRVTISFDEEVFEKVLAMRGKPEHARKSISKIVNELLEKELKDRADKTA